MFMALENKFMTQRMLIDTAHPEETRVVVLHGNRVENFDFESANKKQLRGNVYLAKVTRVEPSLQAAFVEYGGNRHGFLAFSEIHPDYYQIPVSDRETLLKEQAELEERSSDHGESDSDGESDDGDDAETSEDDKVESVGNDDGVLSSAALRRASRRYKIQEVIKRGQIMLVQVVKEERGNKGAAMTTYLSLAGRYCVLMPNAIRGGGISRKISNQSDRKKLKEIVEDLALPEGIAVIVRTAGLQQTKREIKRDFDYLMRLWNNIRETTLKSIAPALIHEEGDLIRRSIRDLYTKDIDEILVAGDAGYRVAKDFMRTLMPSHAKKVQPYKEPIPLFHRHRVENQLDTMFGARVELKSGGYLIINITEALVAIDINSGRSTKERNIEDTALKTNLEASTEIARQLRLRDLAGLIVIDYIDMDHHRNNRAVESRLKDALKIDRARIQVGRISPFGLLEMSRQRMRPTLQETATEPCPQCLGAGSIRSTDSSALHALRAIEDEGMQGRNSKIRVMVPTNIAIYILNEKRSTLAELETRYDFSIEIGTDNSLIPPEFKIDRIGPADRKPLHPTTAEPVEVQDSSENQDSDKATADSGGEDGSGKRRRRRRPRRGKRPEGSEQTDSETASKTADQTADANDTTADQESSGNSDQVAQASSDDSDGETKKRPRRRGRRGGRRNRKPAGEVAAEGASAANETSTESETSSDNVVELAPKPNDEAAAPNGSGEKSGEKSGETPASAQPEKEAQPEVENQPEVETQPEAKVDSGPQDNPEEAASDEVSADVADLMLKESTATKPARSGWWKR